MRNYDMGSSLFWLVLSILVCIQALHLGVGTLRNPGMGFMSFGASGLLGILSLVLFLKALSKREDVKIASIFSGTLWKRVLLVWVALLVYARVMPLGGYLISTFFLMGFLFWIVRGQRWWWVVVLSSLTTVITYYVFSIKLNCQFPEGLLGF